MHDLVAHFLDIIHKALNGTNMVARLVLVSECEPKGRGPNLLGSIFLIIIILFIQP